MACCLLGALIISQVLAFLHFLKRRKPWMWLLAGGIAVTVALGVFVMARDFQTHRAHLGMAPATPTHSH